MTEPTSETVNAWIKLVRAHGTALSVIENALKTASLPPLTWYDVLLEIERSKAEGLRPFELESELLLPQYGVSRLIQRIEDKGYLERRSCDEDGRCQRLFITAEGKRIRTRMWKVYSKAIEHAVGAKLNSKDAKMLAELLEKLI